MPPTPGVLSALGGLIADLKNDFIRTALSADWTRRRCGACSQNSRSCATRALNWLRREQGHAGDVPPHLFGRDALRGQSFEIETPLDGVARGPSDIAAIAGAFHAEHERIYGHADRQAAVQVISLRVVISGETAKPETRAAQAGRRAPRSPSST